MPGMTRRAALGCLLAAVALFGCGDDKDAKFRLQVIPVVARITERVRRLEGKKQAGEKKRARGRVRGDE